MTESSARVPRYRMPVVFGPAAGPRQKADGTLWTAEETGTMRQEWATVRFLGRREQLQGILPPGFELRGEPVVAVQLGFWHDLYWLAGRGYGIVTVLIPTTYHGRDETIDGDFMPVIWEGLADAVITGRDELGFPKLFADIPRIDVDIERGTLRGSASWLGFPFFGMALTGLTEQPVTGAGPQPPTLTYKYVPRTSVGGQGGADIAHVTTGAPRPGAAAVAAVPPLSARSWAGEGSFAFNRATFEQLPTTHAIVNGIAALDVVELRGATYTEVTMPGIAVAGDGQRAVEPRPGAEAVASGTPAALTGA